MTKQRLYMLSFLLLLTSVGCADTSFIKSPGQFLPGARNKAQTRQAARILCLWEAAEGQGLDGQPSRGFAGQILFFGPGDAAPFPVHGAIRIFEYDNFDPDEDSPKPIHAFVFDDGGWNAHRSESTVGESYNVFLPYVKHHKGPATCALKVEFTAENGRTISSPITEVSLQPRQKSAHTQSAISRDIARQNVESPASVSDQATLEVNTPRINNKQLESMTIQLPASGR